MTQERELRPNHGARIAVSVPAARTRLPPGRSTATDSISACRRSGANEGRQNGPYTSASLEQRRLERMLKVVKATLDTRRVCVRKGAR